MKYERNTLERITALECEIADRREFFNDSVAVFNTRIRQVPYPAISGLLGYTPLEMYEVPENEKAPAAVKLGSWPDLTLAGTCNTILTGKIRFILKH